MFNYFELYDKIVMGLGINNIHFAPNYDEKYVGKGKELL